MPTKSQEFFPLAPMTKSDPIEFQSIARTHNSVTLAWNALPDLLGYTLIYRKWTDAEFTTWTPAPNIHETSATILGLESGTTYEFLLTSTTASGSILSLEIETTLHVPVTPTILTATPAQNSVEVTWSRSVNCDGYELWYKARGASDWTIRNIDGASTTSYTIQGLASGITYDIQVRAVDSSTGLVSNWSAQTVTTTVPPAQPPAKPSNFSVKNGTVTSTGLTLTWLGQSNLIGYTLQFKKSSANPSRKH